MYQFKIFVNGTQEVRGEAKVYHAAMMEAALNALFEGK